MRRFLAVAISAVALAGCSSAPAQLASGGSPLPVDWTRKGQLRTDQATCERENPATPEGRGYCQCMTDSVNSHMTEVAYMELSADIRRGATPPRHWFEARQFMSTCAEKAKAGYVP